jgi:hypothetical protein
VKIIFDEYEYAKNLIENGCPRLTLESMKFVTKYWSSEGFGPTEIRKKLIEFCKRINPYFNEIQNRKKIKKALLHCKNNILRKPTPIIITKAEIEEIRAVKDYRIEKFLFAMLVSARFYQKHSCRKIPKINKYSFTLYSNQSISEIKKLAGIKLTVADWQVLKRELTLK